MRADPPGRNRTRPKKIPQGSNAATAPDGHQVRAFPSPMEYISSTDPGGGRMSALFAFKLTLVPFFILALSLAGRRWGTAVSGWLVALPVVAGPIVFFIGMEQGGAFAAGAAGAPVAGRASRGVPPPAVGRFRGVAARDAFVGDRRPHGGGGRHGAPHDRPRPSARAASRGASRPVPRRGDGPHRLHAPLPGKRFPG